MPKITFTVAGAPPYRSTPPNAKEREAQIGRRERLVQAAQVALGSADLHEPWLGDVALTLRFRRGDAYGDALNLLAGAAGLLEAIAYLNDRQIVELHYQESDGQRDEYDIELDLREAV